MSARVVSFHYTLKNKTGETLDSSRDGEPMTFLEGSGQIIPGLESALQSLKVGDQKKIDVAADQAYGEHDPSLVMEIARDKFPKAENIEVGDQFRAGAPGEASPVFTVTAVTSSAVSVDGNHPLAGEDLFFDVEVTQIREATADELSHGHAHGEHGHGHDHDHDDEDGEFEEEDAEEGGEPSRQ